MDAVLYIHGKGGSAEESGHYAPLFPGCKVVGLDYLTFTPWETGKEISNALKELKTRFENVVLIANSIGAFFSTYAGLDGLVERAYFISPVVDMEGLILGMMAQAGVTEAELKEKGIIAAENGDLSWEYLSFVRENTPSWKVPTNILYGSGDMLTPPETIRRFAEVHGASLTVMDGGEHWFHTEEQMRFLDRWISKCEEAERKKQYQKEYRIMDKNVIIRPERREEYRAVENLVRESFWNVYRPGCLEHYVLHKLRDDPAFVKELDFVMEKDGEIIGQNMFMRAVIKADDGRDVPIMSMGPICIAPEYKRQGYGKLLLGYSLEKAAEAGCPALCFEGNIGFYGTCGFTYARDFGIRYHDLPEGADSSFFLCKELIPGYLDGVTGEYTPPKGYFVDEKEAEEFDKLFPPKEKLRLPGQLFG